MFSEPTYLIQFGYNGQTLVRRALDNDHTDGVILSPTDYDFSDNVNLSEDVSDEGKTVLFDPQFYIPRTERVAAQTYPYFEERGGDNFETVFVSDPAARQSLCKQILEVQDQIGVDAYITPARYLDTFSQHKIEQWLRLTKSFLEVAYEEGRDIPVFASLPVSGTSLVDQSARIRLLDRVTSAQPDGFYVSVEYDRYRRHPFTGVNEIIAYLDLLKCLRINRFEVLLGHTDQIAHLALGMGVNAFASGHYKNTKAFDTDRWIPQDTSFGQGGVHYYYTDSLLANLRVEQDLQKLSAARGFNLGEIRMQSPYEEELFRAASPEEADWKSAEAEWDHWIWCCYKISRKYRNSTLDERLQTASDTLDSAHDLYRRIESSVGPLDSVDEEFYSHWRTAFDSTVNTRDMNEIKRVLSSPSFD